MADPVGLPAMGEAQKQSWHALMDLYERINSDWTLIGGQLVHLHCAERGASPTRPTNDIDTVVDIRASQMMLATFTGVLKDMGFTPEHPLKESSTAGAAKRPRSTSSSPRGLENARQLSPAPAKPRPSVHPAPPKPSNEVSP